MLLLGIILNVIFSVIIVICEKKPKSIIFWLIIIIFFNFFGFLIYLVFGNRLKIREKWRLLKKEKTTKNYLKYCKWYKNYNKNDYIFNGKQIKLIRYLKNKYNSNIWHNNKIKIFYKSNQFLNDIIIELKNAKNFINMEFYIFADDKVGNIIADILKQKAKQGVKVKIIYDAIGSRKTNILFWRELEQYGVKVASFFSSPFNLNFLNLKANYRNHRKLVCIDGLVSFTGGINLRDDHMGKDKILRPWRDTQIKLIGSASYAINNVFLNDWKFARNEDIESDLSFYFPRPSSSGCENIGILESGAEKQETQIKNAYVHIIKMAEEYLYIQTPYFIIEKDLLNEITKAKTRGVDIKIMIPAVADKKIVYLATLFCIKKLMKLGVEVYLYNGFIHSKTLNTEFVLSIGSCNFDNRSFKLNFELTALMYNVKTIKKYKKIYEDDMQNSKMAFIKDVKMPIFKYLFAWVIYKFLGKLL